MGKGGVEAGAGNLVATQAADATTHWQWQT